MNFLKAALATTILASSGEVVAARSNAPSRQSLGIRGSNPGTATISIDSSGLGSLGNKFGPTPLGSDTKNGIEVIKDKDVAIKSDIKLREEDDCRSKVGVSLGCDQEDKTSAEVISSTSPKDETTTSAALTTQKADTTSVALTTSTTSTPAILSTPVIFKNISNISNILNETVSSALAYISTPAPDSSKPPEPLSTSNALLQAITNSGIIVKTTTPSPLINPPEETFFEKNPWFIPVVAVAGTMLCCCGIIATKKYLNEKERVRAEAGAQFAPHDRIEPNDIRGRLGFVGNNPAHAQFQPQARIEPHNDLRPVAGELLLRQRGNENAV